MPSFGGYMIHPKPNLQAKAGPKSRSRRGGKHCGLRISKAVPFRCCAGVENATNKNEVYPLPQQIFHLGVLLVLFIKLLGVELSIKFEYLSISKIKFDEELDMYFLSQFIFLNLINTSRIECFGGLASRKLGKDERHFDVFSVVLYEHVLESSTYSKRLLKPRCDMYGDFNNRFFG